MIRSIALAGVAFASIHVLPERVDKPIVCDAVLKTSNGSVPDSLDVRVVQADGKNERKSSTLYLVNLGLVESFWTVNGSDKVSAWRNCVALNWVAARQFIIQEVEVFEADLEIARWHLHDFTHYRNFVDECWCFSGIGHDNYASHWFAGLKFFCLGSVHTQPGALVKPHGVELLLHGAPLLFGCVPLQDTVDDLSASENGDENANEKFGNDSELPARPNFLAISSLIGIGAICTFVALFLAIDSIDRFIGRTGSGWRVIGCLGFLAFALCLTPALLTLVLG